jgi:hypothetical protein
MFPFHHLVGNVADLLERLMERHLFALVVNHGAIMPAVQFEAFANENDVHVVG